MGFGTIFDLNRKLARLIKKTVGYWVGGGFILFCTMAILIGINTIVDIHEGWFIGAGLAIASILISYAYHHAKKMFIHSISFSSNKISKSYHFVQLSDIHIGSNEEEEVQRILNHMESLMYDFVVITGDLVDEDFASEEAVQLLNNIEKPIYYITGNHEYYLRHRHFSDFIKQTNIIDINDKKISIDNELTLFGIDEKSLIQKVIESEGVDTHVYNIGLMHEPNKNQLKKANDLGIDLMLSGHTHSGQIFPLTLLVKLRYLFLHGLYKINKMHVYVSQGTGTWGPKMRLGSNNEITLITLVPEK